MEKLKLVATIEDERFGNPSTYQIYVNKNRGTNAGMTWYYYDLYVKRGEEWIYRFFECLGGNCINQVKEGYKEDFLQFLDDHDIHRLNDVDIVPEVKVVV